MEDKLKANGWSRQELTLRLSRRRLAKLKGIANGMPPGATPTEAIDHAIEQARFGHADYSDHLVRIAEIIDAEGEQGRIASSRIESQVRALAQAVDALRALILAVADAASEDA